MMAGIVAAIAGAGASLAGRTPPTAAPVPTKAPAIPESLALAVENGLKNRLKELWDAAGVDQRCKFRIVPQIRVELDKDMAHMNTRVLVRADIRVLLANGELQPSAPLTMYEYVDTLPDDYISIPLCADRIRGSAIQAFTKVILTNLEKFAIAAAELSKTYRSISYYPAFTPLALPAPLKPPKGLADLYSAEIAEAYKKHVILEKMMEMEMMRKRDIDAGKP